MYEVVIDRTCETWSELHAIGREITNIIAENSNLVKELQDYEQPLEKNYNNIYEIKNTGAILCRERHTFQPYKFHTEISLIGFNEDESEIFKNLKEGLEKISKTEENLG